ncbi:CDP-diacylglycerol--glycerol-3-phosphate 3-phosphatidyltransferase [Elusimicrobiota bacterium]
MTKGSIIGPATILTLIRIIMVIPFVTLIYIGNHTALTAALVLFTVASLTDYLDGKIARARNEVTDIGKFLDPLADKIFVVSAYIVLLGIKSINIPSWPIILIISREFIINGFRTMAASKGLILAASTAGKIKTAVQMISVILLLLILIADVYHKFAAVIIYIASFLSVFSGIEYMIKNRRIFFHYNSKEETE